MAGPQRLNPNVRKAQSARLRACPDRSRRESAVFRATKKPRVAGSSHKVTNRHRQPQQNWTIAYVPETAFQ